MDLNYLLHRHQVSLIRADYAACEPARVAHRELASLYAREIAREKRRSRDSIDAPQV